jgi:hypothetical protein
MPYAPYNHRLTDLVDLLRLKIVPHVSIDSERQAGPTVPFGLLSAELWRAPAKDPSRSGPIGSRTLERRIHDPVYSLRPLPYRPGIDPAPQMQLLATDRSDAGDSNDPNTLPDSVVNQFREQLDEPSLRFLKRGPRTYVEQLAFAQGVQPDAHLFAASAPDDIQRMFDEHGTFDRTRFFVGADGLLYTHGEKTSEPLAFRLRRGIENAVGGYERPHLSQLVPTVLSVPNSPAGSAAGPQLARDGAGGGSESSVPPLPPPIPGIKSVLGKFQRVERDIRGQGLTVGADALRHFMERSGLPIEYDHAQFRSYPVVQERRKVFSSILLTG